jgi:HEAT repeat protein
MARADLVAGESLPDAYRELVSVGAGIEKCPLCGTYYRYRYEYEYLIPDSTEDAYLDRLTRDEAIAELFGAREINDEIFEELEALGFEDARSQFFERLYATLGSDDKSAHHYALLALFRYYQSTDPGKIDDLLNHDNPMVRKDTLYFMMTHGTLRIPLLLGALSDPDPDVRNHAGWAIRENSLVGSLGDEAYAALARVVASDPVPDVRRQAADALASAAKHGGDISLAVPALTGAIGANASVTGSAVYALREAAVRGADISPAIEPIRKCLEAGVLTWPPAREAATEALRLAQGD